MNRKKRIRRQILLLTLLILFVSLALYFPLRVFPYMQEVAENQVVNAVSGALTKAMTEQLRFGTVDYSKVIILERDTSGNVTALRTDMAQVARLKAEIFEILDDLVLQIDEHEIGIPIGSLVFPGLFAGKGFRLPVRIIALSTSNSEFFSDFTSAGINQTLQTIRMTFTVGLTIHSPAGKQDLEVSNDVIIAQTVLVGQVPQTMISLGE